MSIYQEFIRTVKKNPENCAINSLSDNTISYSELKAYTDSFMAFIHDKLGDAEYVGVIDDQNPLAIIAIISLIFSGKKVLLIDPRLEKRAIHDLLSKYSNWYFSESHKETGTIKHINYQDAINYTNHETTADHSNDGGYVIFTSGSTGTPKAVLVKSPSLLSLAKVLSDKYYINDKTNVFQFSYLSFDSSLAEIWTAILSGGTLLVPGKEIRLSPYRLMSEMPNYNNLTITLPPSFAKELSTSVLDKISTLILAGEECPCDLANRCRKHVNHLINAYGPTESIICASTYEILDEQTKRVPIGHTIDGVRIKLSEEGEILIHSNRLFERYLGLDSDNCTIQDNERWFHSGDLGRIRPDGVIEYIGRKDNQVKINGQRIEIEGLEYELRQKLKLENLYIVAQKSQNNSKLIVVVTDKSDLEVVKAFYSSTSYKRLPWGAALIERFPLNLNGKIDRRELLRQVATITKSSFDNNIDDKKEEKLLSLWKSVFGAAPSSMDAGFFASGGDSLKALKLIKLLDDEYKIQINLIDVLRNKYSFNDLKALIKDNSK